MEVPEDAVNGMRKATERTFTIYFRYFEDKDYTLEMEPTGWKLYFHFSHLKCDFRLEMTKFSEHDEISLPIYLEYAVGFPADNQSYKMRHFLAKFNLGDCTMSHELIIPASSGITCRCELRLFYQPDDETSNSNLPAINVPDCSLIKDITQSLRNESFSDVDIFIDEKVIPAHKIILSARSRIFASLLSNNQKGRSRIDVEGIGYDAMNQVLSYIYSGEASDIEEHAEAILIAADRYDLGRLKAQCEDHLVKTVNFENACELMIKATLYNADQLLKGVKVFMKWNFLAVKRTNGFRDLATTHPHLLMELLENYEGKIVTPKNQTVIKLPTKSL